MFGEAHISTFSSVCAAKVYNCVIDTFLPPSQLNIGGKKKSNLLCSKRQMLHLLSLNSNENNINHSLESQTNFCFFRLHTEESRGKTSRVLQIKQKKKKKELDSNLETKRKTETVEIMMIFEKKDTTNTRKNNNIWSGRRATFHSFSTSS